MKGKRLAQLAEILNCPENTISPEGDKENITGFAVDSRQVAPGMLFIALKGYRVNGEDFLEEVAQKGAIGAIVSKEYRGPDFGLVLLFVESPLSALQQLAHKAYAERGFRSVAVTGSVGKTTTKEFIVTLLEAKYRVIKTPGNANSQVGLPLAILNGEEQGDCFVCEMAMSEPGQIKKLIEIIPPDIAVLTKIGVSHAAFFEGGIEEIAAAKAEIFSHSERTLAVINASTRRFEAISQLTNRKIIFGEKESLFDYSIDKVMGGVAVKERGVEKAIIPLAFDASHLLENFCAALVVARQFGLTWEEITVQAQKLKPFKRRFEKIEKEGFIYINDSYNASPESMQAALINLPLPVAQKKRIAVLGEMRELGAYQVSGHEQVAREALNWIDHLICLGKGCLPMVEIFKEAQRPVDYFEDFEAMRLFLKQTATPGDIILLKGANSHALWRLAEE